MTSRERVLAAMEGREPDRVPRALSFYRVDLARLAPPDEYRPDLVDVQFVSFPPSPEEEELRRVALPFAPETRLG